MISDKFFEDEVREGFYVPSAIKQAWGAQLAVLEELDRVCKKYNIEYYAEWGTFLGAVRHGGIIPWDDDFDIGMKRKDYELFLSVWRREMPEEYDVITFRDHPEHTKFLANVVNCSTICYMPEHLKANHGFPFIAGIDIFVADYINRNSVIEKNRVNLATYIILVADEIFDGKIDGVKKNDVINYIERNCNVIIDRDLRGEELRANMYAAAEKLFAQFTASEADELAQMMPYGLGFGVNKLTYPKDSYEEFIRIPFEETTIPVPREYVSMLKKHYGQFMKLVKNSGVHNYPYFEAQKEDVVKLISRAYPQYLFDASSLAIERSPREGTYKATVLECIAELKHMYEALETAVRRDDKSLVQNTLADSQQLAIDLGEYIEGIKGEGYDIIHILEDYCETLFGVFDIIINGNTGGYLSDDYFSDNCLPDDYFSDNCLPDDYLSDLDNNSVVHGKNNASDNNPVNHLVKHVKDVVYKLEKTVTTRREVVFLPFKPDYWDTMENFYFDALRAADTDVYVVPIPYYYKEYDGTLRSEQYDFDKYPSELNCIRYDEFNYEIHHPDIIYIQNPYDEWNDVTSVNPFFYSKNIIKYTDKLVYIPWFRIVDFDKDCEREYMNMKYYCTMPGVVIADEVVVGSGRQKNNYVDKLTEFAGSDTKHIWENKIKIREEGSCGAGKKNSLTAKYFVYCADFSSFLVHGELTIRKIEKSITEILHSDKGIMVVIAEQDYLRTELRKYDEKLLGRYEALLSVLEDNPRVATANYGGNDAEIILEEPKGAGFGNSDLRETSERHITGLSFDELIGNSLAYYGDETKLAHFFRNEGKSVMIQNYELI